MVQFKKQVWRLVVLMICFKLTLTSCTLTSDANDVAPNNGSAEQLNILWLVVEDMSPIIAPYGDFTAATPAINQLAQEGVVFTNVYSTSGVCAPSRAALALGMYPSGMGANHMRTSSNTDTTGLPKYEAVPPAEAKLLSQYLRQQGYYTTNNYKTDYQLQAPKAAWHDSSRYGHWRNRPEGTPFYSVVNFTTTHESGLFEPYGIRKIESRHYYLDDKDKIDRLPNHHSIKTEESETPVHIAKDSQFPIPPYLPDTPVVRRDLWKMYNNLIETDKQIGAVLQQLKDDDLYDKTIIVFYSDHGGPLPRQKRLIYDSGLKVPMIIRFPNKRHAGTQNDQLISFVDFAPTTLALAGIDIPSHMQGHNFIGDLETLTPPNPRQYVHAAADRFDGFTDTIRAVKNKRFKYIRNYRPEQGYYLPVAYREKIPTMQELLRLHQTNSLNAYQAQWFREKKPAEELFDTLNDPHELHNLASNPQYQAVVKELSQEMDRWLTEIGDEPLLPERQLIETLWQGQDTMPKTMPVNISVKAGFVNMSSETKGATISYRIALDGEKFGDWQLYQQPLQVKPRMKIKVVAQRLGYLESATVEWTF